MVNETLRVANIISGVFRRAMTDVTIKGEFQIVSILKKCAKYFLTMLGFIFEIRRLYNSKGIQGLCLLARGTHGSSSLQRCSGF